MKTSLLSTLTLLSFTLISSAQSKPKKLLKPGQDRDFKIFKDKKTKENFVEDSYVIEFVDGATLGKRDGESVNVHTSFYNHLNSNNLNYKIRQEFHSPLFSGVSIHLPSSDNHELITPDHAISKLSAMPQVNKAWRNRRYERMSVGEIDVEGLIARRRLEAEMMGDALEEREPGFGIVEDPLLDLNMFTPRSTKSETYKPLPASKFKNDTFPPHVMTHVSELHEQGILGKGIKIAIADTGVDYKHPALGGCFGKGCKISFGEDLVGDDYDGSNVPVPGGDPYDPCGHHGTHVAGIVGADPNPYGFTGVAPQAELGMYRIFGCTGGAGDDVIIKSMILAHEAGADITTLSLGGGFGWTENPASLVANRINELGKIVMYAAGNSGDDGMFYASYPAAGVHTWSIGSVETTGIPVRFATADTGFTFEYYSLLTFNVSNLPVYATSTNLTTTTDACNPLPDDTPDLGGYLVVIQRGTCLIDTKLTNAAAKGAKYVFISNNGGVPFYDDGSTDGITGGAALIPTDAGAYLRRRFSEGKKTSVSFTSHKIEYVPNGPSGGFMDSFSTYGPSNDMLAQPSFSGPGGNIVSTLPLRLGGYGLLSGTSMATPHVAGATALFLQARGRSLNSTQIRSIFATTSQILNDSATNQVVETVIHQGAGMINIQAAINTRTLISPNELQLNDTANFRGTPSIFIQNKHTTKRTYKVTHIPASTALNFAEGSNYPALVPELTQDYAKVVLGHEEITLAPGEGWDLKVKFTPPTQNTDRFPVYSGWIVFTSGTEVLKVPYFGLAAALKNAQVIDSGDEVLGVQVPLILAGKNVTAAPIQYGPRTYTMTGDHFPSLLFRLLMGTPFVSVDLVDADIHFTPTIDDAYNVKPASSTTKRDIKQRSLKFSQVPTIGNIPELTGPYWPRNTVVDTDTLDYTFTWDGTISVNGKTKHAPNGRYRFLLRAQRIATDHNQESNWDSWLSPIIKVERV